MAGTPALSHSDTAACRRSYGRAASGEATWCGGSAGGRTSCHTLEYVEEDTGRLRRISRANWFAIAERDEQSWVRVGYGENAGARAGWYALERHDRSDGHYRATTSDISEVIDAFQRFAQEDDAWIDRFAWNPVSL